MNSVLTYSICCSILANLVLCDSFAYPDQGKWDFHFDSTLPMDDKNNQVPVVVKSLFNDSQVIIKISCQQSEESQGGKLTIKWTLAEVACWRDYLNKQMGNSVIQSELQKALQNTTLMSPVQETDCSEHIQLLEVRTVEEDAEKIDVQSEAANSHGMPEDPDGKETERRKRASPIHSTPSRPGLVYTVPKDGFYMLTLYIKPKTPFPYSVDVHLELKGKHGYLSAADWPLLPFYGAMCLVYVVLGMAWLIVSFLQWRDLLRIQFWIGAVILLGMLEKAMFYAEYQNINSTGQSSQMGVMVAELVSCGKRTLARMLVIIVSLGFGIVKPRLGPMLHRTVATGSLYFLLAGSEAYLRVARPPGDPANQMLMASVPLAVLDSAICWWIFTSLVQTTRTLRLRRNVVKLNLYRHFTNTLIFAVFSSIIFMLYSIKAHYLVSCFTAWKELWIDDAYWKLLFSVILLVIMILWRPSGNNQRYAFTPLLDAPEDGDDEEEEYFVSDAYGVKMRGGINSGTSSPKQKLSTNSAEDDLKWVEENIPTSLADSALPILDSDEEVINTRFELSKMQ